MILKTLLKYKIFEWCLDTIFNKIKLNFSKVEIKGILHTGDRVNNIKYRMYDEYGNLSNIYEYYDCTILRVDTLVIKFSYMTMRTFPQYIIVDAYGICTHSLSDIEFCE